MICCPHRPTQVGAKCDAAILASKRYSGESSRCVALDVLEAFSGTLSEERSANFSYRPPLTTIHLFRCIVKSVAFRQSLLIALVLCYYEFRTFYQKERRGVSNELSRPSSETCCLLARKALLHAPALFGLPEICRRICIYRGRTVPRFNKHKH